MSEIDKLIATLESLRGTHDQTMRCGAINAIYGTDVINGKTPTERFLENQILLAKVCKRGQ